ncbi:MAG: acyl-CoA thioesterase [Alphaproteobacteria bacterium]|nr:acyl-CoA thioesterase [Alphaproteobacteria bacterium]
MARSDYRFSFPFRVRYAEVDGQSVVFNAHYLTYYDTTLTEYMRAAEYDYMGQVARTGTDIHVVRSVVEYKQTIRFDEEIEVHARCAKMGRSSVTFLLEIHPKGRDDLRATGEVVWVNADQTTHKSAPLPADFVAAMEAMEGRKLAGG